MHRTRHLLRRVSGANVELGSPQFGDLVARNKSAFVDERWSASCTCIERWQIRRGFRVGSKPLGARLAADQEGLRLEYGDYRHASEAGPSFSKHMPYLHRLNEPAFSTRVDEESSGDPYSTLRIDAYQHLKEHAPSLLAHVSDEGLVALCDEAARNSFGTVVEELLSDLAPNSDILAHRHSMHWFQHSDGAFNSPRGSHRRSKALQQLLTSALTSNASQSQRPQSWSNVQHCMPLMSAANLKRTCQLLMQDLALLNRSTMVETSTLLSDVHLIAARWLMMTIARNNDTSLVALVTALWQHVNAQAAHTSTDFPAPVEADALVRFYLSLEEVADDVVIGTLKMQDEHARQSDLDDQSPKALLIANAVADAINAKQPLLVKQSTFQMASTIANELDNFFVRGNLTDRAISQYVERLRLHACMAIVNAQNGDGDSALRCIEDGEQLLNDLRIGRMALTPQYMLLSLTRTVFQILINRGGEKATLRSATTLNTFLRKIVEAACFAPSSTNMSDLTIVREYCEQVIANGDHLRAYNIIVSAADIIGRASEKKRSSIVQIFGGDVIADIADDLARVKDSPRLQQLLFSLDLLDNKLFPRRSVDFDRLFTLHQRSRLIRAYALSHLASFTASLYTACVPAQKEPWTVEGITEGLETAFESTEQTTTAKVKNKAATNDATNAVVQSSECMLAIVTVMSRGAMQRWFKKFDHSGVTEAPLKLQLAYHALFTFTQSKPPSMWEYDDVIRMVKALFRLGHDQYALRCLSALAMRKDAFTEELLTVLIRGLAQIDLAKAIDLLTMWKQEKGFAASLTNEVLTPIATQLLISRDPKLCERFWSMITSDTGIEGANSLQLQTIAALSIVTVRPKRGALKLRRALEKAVSAVRDPNGRDGTPDVPDLKILLEQRTEAELKLWNWLRRLIERGTWRPEPALFRWMILRCAAQSNFYHTFEPDESLASLYSDLAGRFLYLGAMRLGRVDDIAANAVLKSIHSPKESPPTKAFSSSVRAHFNALDKITSAMRWALMYRHAFSEELYLNEMLSDGGALSADDGDACMKVSTADGTLCNVLPVGTFRALILTYLRLGDTLGAASVMEWARDECKLNMQDLSKDFVSKKNRQKMTFAKVIQNSVYNARVRSGTEAGSKSETLSWMSGETSVPKTKSWWSAPIIDSTV